MNTTALHRRDFLYGFGSSLGGLAFTDLLAREAVAGPLQGVPLEATATSVEADCYLPFYL